jgi:hypothetical protein
MVFNIRPIILLIVVAGGVVNILRTAQTRIRGSISGRGKKKISFLLTVNISSKAYPFFHSVGTGSKAAVV